MAERTTDWAFGLLRPVLQKLKIQELKDEPIIVRASEYRGLIIAGMGKWVIIARQFSMNDRIKGIAEFFISKPHNIFHI